MAERQQLSSQGGVIVWAGGEEDSDGEDCEITAVIRLDDPVASFDLCEEEDGTTKEAMTVAAQQNSELPSTTAAAPTADAAGNALDKGEAQMAKLTALWQSTKFHVDHACKVQPDLLGLEVTETGVCSNNDCASLCFALRRGRILPISSLYFCYLADILLLQS